MLTFDFIVRILEENCSNYENIDKIVAQAQNQRRRLNQPCGPDEKVPLLKSIIDHSSFILIRSRIS